MEVGPPPLPPRSMGGDGDGDGDGDGGSADDALSYGSGSSLESPAPPRSFDPEFALPPHVKAELASVEDQLDHRTIMTGLRGGLASGCATGVVGAIKFQAVSTEALSAAINTAERIGPKAGVAKALLRTCWEVKRIREAVLALEWHTVQNLLNDNGFECGTAMTTAATDGRVDGGGATSVGAGAVSASASSGVAGGLVMPMAFRRRAFEALPRVESELKLLASEVNNQAILAHLSGVLMKGSATGVVGDLDVSTVDVVAPAAALKVADAMGLHTAKATMLYSVTKAVLQLRKIVVRGVDRPSVCARVHDVLANVCVAGFRCSVAVGAVRGYDCIGFFSQFCLFDYVLRSMITGSPWRTSWRQCELLWGTTYPGQTVRTKALRHRVR